jgi:hypothetical protein
MSSSSSSSSSSPPPPSSLLERIARNLQRKLWDNNAFIAQGAVRARDTLAGGYVGVSRLVSSLTCQGASHVHDLYCSTSRVVSASEDRLPKPVSLVLVPAFRGVEASVEFVAEGGLGRFYGDAKHLVAELPLGKSLVVPALDLAEKGGQFCLAMLQAPFPSGDRVAQAAEAGLDSGKSGLIRAARELWLYLDLLDVQVTRTLTRAQWDILGTGPYAELPMHQQEEVADRICEKYFGLLDPLRRYEFLALVRWNNPPLHEALVGTGLLLGRAKEAGCGRFLGDAWLDPDAPWRKGKHHYSTGVVLDDVSEREAAWFWRRQGGGSKWLPFSAMECRRLERSYQEYHQSPSPERASGEVRAARTHSIAYEPSGSATNSVHTYDLGKHDIFVDQGRLVVDMEDLMMRPVYWAYSGEGDEVRRAVWLQEMQGEPGSLECLRPYPPEAASVLEDAHQFLRWYLGVGRSSAHGSSSEEEGDGGPVESPVLLTVQVLDQLVQFRGMDDMVCVRRTLGGAMSLLGRNRVYRGLPQIASVVAHGDFVTPVAANDDASPTRPSPPSAAAAEAVEERPLEGPEATLDPASCANAGIDDDLEEPVEHLILVVHGIGDALSTMDLGVVQLKSLIDCCDSLRSMHAEALDGSPSLQSLRPPAGSRGRVEYLPVEWHSRFKTHLRGRPAADAELRGEEGLGGNALSIWDITLKRAAALRAYTNDAMLDILYFMSPQYHNVIVKEVAQEINRVLALYRKHARSFSGKVSIFAHSLGAIICFDICDGSSNVAGTFPPLSSPIENLFCLGSPIGMFLMIRKEHGILGKEFRLTGAKRLLNIFHPLDPVAYRLEPLIMGQHAAQREAEIVPTWQGGLRVHYQVKQWWQEGWTSAMLFKERVESGLERALGNVGLIDDLDESQDYSLFGTTETSTSRVGRDRAEPLAVETAAEDESDDKEGVNFDSNGALAEGLRIDYSLQEKEIEVTQENLWALGSHVAYWTSKDASHFIASMIYKGEAQSRQQQHCRGGDGADGGTGNCTADSGGQEGSEERAGARTATRTATTSTGRINSSMLQASY